GQAQPLERRLDRHEQRFLSVPERNLDPADARAEQPEPDGEITRQADMTTHFNLTRTNSNGQSRIGEAMRAHRLAAVAEVNLYETLFARVRERVLHDREGHISQADLTKAKPETRERVRQIAREEIAEHNRLAPSL